MEVMLLHISTDLCLGGSYNNGLAVTSQQSDGAPLDCFSITTGALVVQLFTA